VLENAYGDLLRLRDLGRRVADAPAAGAIVISLVGRRPALGLPFPGVLTMDVAGSTGHSTSWLAWKRTSCELHSAAELVAAG
jgi:hypothetical protein